MSSNTNELRHVQISVLITSLIVSTAVLAQTPWPDFMPYLQPDVSESSERAPLPDDIDIRPPAESVKPEFSKWSGQWSGWAGRDRVIETKLVVEYIDADGADIVCSRTLAGAAPIVERVRAEFIDEELRATLSTGTKVSYRLRNTETAELVWVDPGGNWMAGVVAKQASTGSWRTTRIPTALSEDGAPVSLEAVVALPSGAGPFPTIVFNHGSSGIEQNPVSVKFTTITPAVARFFNERGWAVVFPQRRGRGKSDGKYAEGLNKDGVRYSNSPRRSLLGLTRALEDLDQVVIWLNTEDEFDVSKMLVAGHSRGGLLALVYAGTRPTTFRGVINFMGGWVDESAPKVEKINAVSFERGAEFSGSSLWLYADNDPFYSLAHSRSNFAAFTKNGGKGKFVELPVAGHVNGHVAVSDSATWGPFVDALITELGI